MDSSNLSEHSHFLKLSEILCKKISLSQILLSLLLFWCNFEMLFWGFCGKVFLGQKPKKRELFIHNRK